MLLRVLLLVATLLLSPLSALADECIPNLVDMNVCNFAKEMQQKAAPSLPMQMSQNLMLEKIMAFGPRLVMSSVWKLSKDDLEKNLVMNSMTMGGLAEKMRGMTQTLVCGREEPRAFVRLGGEVEYSYMTQDGHPITSVVIKECSAP